MLEYVSGQKRLAGESYLPTGRGLLSQRHFSSMDVLDDSHSVRPSYNSGLFVSNVSTFITLMASRNFKPT